MDIKQWTGKALSVLGKYRYAVLILVIGVALMLMPDLTEELDNPPPETTAQSGGGTVEDQLAQLLSCIDGAGRVEVMLSLACGEQTLYQSDADISNAADSSTQRFDTVTVTDADRNQTGLVTQVNPPVYLGAVIVCQGADDPEVKLAIVDAVSKFTGLGANKISVLKMK